MNPVSRVLLVALVVCSGPRPGRADDRPTLTVLNWSWYVQVDEELDVSLPIVERSPLLQRFEREFGCKVRYLEFDEEVAMRDLLISRPHEIDLVNLSPAFCSALFAQGLVRPIDLERVPHHADLRPVIARSVGTEGPTICVPYFAGHTGLLVNREVTAGPVDGWARFWDPEAPFAIGLLGGPEVILGSALILDGHPIASNDPTHLRAAATHVLASLAADRVRYVGDDVEEVADAVADGTLGAATLYSSDALGYVDGESIEFVLPAEGVEVFVDCWAISSRSDRSDLAHAFIDFMLRPEVQVGQSLALDTQVVTRTARDVLQRDHGDHPHLPFLIGLPPDSGPPQSMIHREDTREIEHLWSRILERASR